ncbi:hypothetical protein DX932_10575 [Bacillus cereus]|uniref:Uncharacterized protein n=1 Tax=Bacillus cereus TaxID=1396 RepID=A0A9W7US85_BACCE|nr:hypothetical protein [Bacillus cereus]KAA6470262.1 hypothetical protein DX932_10575 [Bacillus cereus]KAB2503892.1 hypothetical protein F8156_13010 [Bacillus cereus]
MWIKLKRRHIMSISISELENQLKEATINNTVFFTNLPFLSQEVQQRLLQINQDVEIIVESSQISVQEEVLILKGKVSLLGIDSLDAMFQFMIVEEQVEFIAKIPVPDTMPLSFGITELALNNILIEINTNTQSNEILKAILSGNVNLEGQVINLTKDLLVDKIFSGNIPTFSLQSILSVLCGKNIQIPGISDLTIQDAHFIINVSSTNTSVNLWANVNSFGRLQLLTSNYAGSWEYIAILSLLNEWKFSSISSILSVLDSLKFKEPKLTISSVTDSSALILSEDSQEKTISVVEGLYFSGILQMEGLGLELLRVLLKISEIPIGGLIGQNPANTKFEADLYPQLDLLGVTFNDVGLVLQVEPFIIGIQLSTIVQIQDDTLRFNGGIQLQQDGASYSLTMPGKWEKPFGLPMLDIENVLLQFQTNPDPKLAVAGDISFGDDLFVNVTCRFTSSGVPDTLIGNLNGELSISRLIKVFTGITIPEGFLDISISDVSIYIVASPLGADIGGIHYPFGFRAHGQMNAYGVEATSQMSIQENGISLDGQLTPINVGDVLKIYGETMEQGPKVLYRATAEEPFLFQLEAGIQILGATLNTHILVKQDGFEFAFSERIFNSFNASIEAEATGELNQGNFYIRASMHNDMIEYVNNQTRQMLKEITSSADSNVSNKQTEISNVEQQLASLNDEIEKRIKEINDAIKDANEALGIKEKEKDAAEKILREAEKVRNRAASALKEVKNKKNEIKKLLRNLNKQLIDARKIFDPVSQARTIKRLVKDIADWERELRKVEDQLNPLDALTEEFKMSKRNFNAANRALKKAQKHLNNILPAERDPFIIGKQVVKETLSQQIELLRSQFGLLQVFARKAAQVVAFITAQGIESLFNVSSISFEGNIQSVGAGQVSLSMDVSFMGGTQNIELAFNFQDPVSGIRSLSERLVQLLS